jgi:uncharacterized membrane protein
MTLKQYQIIRLVITIIIAIVVSQSFMYKNYLIPIATVALSSLFLIYIKGKVKEVIADERDYTIGGKAALLAMQIYCWLAVIAMFILYANNDLNPAYMAVATTLAYSTCALMILYSLIFRYYNKIIFSDRKVINTFLIIVLLAIMIIAGIRLFSGEDDWICQNGQWVKHGQPSFPAPTRECK